MRTKYALTIYKTSIILNDVTRLIGNHNEGIVKMDIVDFIALVHVNRLLYPHTYSLLVAQRVGNKVMISDDNFTSYSLIITLLEDGGRELGDLKADQNGIVTTKTN